MLRLLFFLLLLNSTQVFSAWRWNLSLGTFDSNNRAERVQIAEELKSEIKLMLAAIPSLSPDENNWREKELQKINDLKGNNLYAQRLFEFGDHEITVRYKAIEYLEVIQSNLEAVVNAEGDLNNEMASWLMVSHKLVDRTYVSEVFESLIANKIIPADVFQPFGADDSEGYAFLHYMYGSGIIEFIILDYIKSLSG